jgi:hypothetical protein
MKLKKEIMTKFEDVAGMYLGCTGMAQFEDYTGEIETVIGICKDELTTNKDAILITSFKPILRPLSSMTEDEAREMGFAGMQIGLLAYPEIEMFMTAKQFKESLSKHFDLFNLHENNECIYESDLPLPPAKQ